MNTILSLLLLSWILSVTHLHSSLILPTDWRTTTSWWTIQIVLKSVYPILSSPLTMPLDITVSLSLFPSFVFSVTSSQNLVCCQCRLLWKGFNCSVAHPVTMRILQRVLVAILCVKVTGIIILNMSCSLSTELLMHIIFVLVIVSSDKLLCCCSSF